MQLSIIIPVFNEQATIEQVVRECANKIISHWDDAELLVIDDRSTDGTARLLRGLELQIPQLRVIRQGDNLGHGQAIRVGYEAAVGDWIFQLDSDLQFFIQDFWTLWGQRESAEAVLGVREERRDPLFRRCNSFFLRFLIGIRHRIWLRDANCPFRLMRRESVVACLRQIPQSTKLTNVLLSIAFAKQKKAKQVPVRHRARTAGTSSLKSWRLITHILSGAQEVLFYPYLEETEV